RTGARSASATPPRWAVRRRGFLLARRTGLASDGTRIVAAIPALADVDAAHPVPVQRLVGHLVHAPHLFLARLLACEVVPPGGTGGDAEKSNPRSGKSSALPRCSPLRTARATHRGIRLQRAARATPA